MKAEKEITKPVLLCDERGKLNPDAVGWSRKPLHTCNLKGRWPRKKKWNYWCITNDKYAFSVTVANVDYLSLGAAYFVIFAEDSAACSGDAGADEIRRRSRHLDKKPPRYPTACCGGGFVDFETKEIIEWNTGYPAGLGSRMNEHVDDDVLFSHPQMKLSFKHESNGISIHAAGKKLKANFLIEKPVDHETLNAVVPWGSNHFQFTSKQNTLRASGAVEMDKKTYAFSRENSFACLDFGRGIWPYRTQWNWASSSARHEGKTIGLNLGGMWTDGTGSTENGVCVNGKLYKISEDVKFQYDRKNFMEPWKIFTPESDTVNLTFTPFFEKKNKLNLLVLRTEVHQMFGKFSGAVKTLDGNVIFHDFIGWAEESISKW